MSAILEIENFGQQNVRQQSTLNLAYTAGGTTITPKNSNGMVADLFLLVGRGGDESSELPRIQSVSGGVVTMTAAMAYDHIKYTQILVLAANQIKIYRAANVDGTVPADSAFGVAIATVAITPDQLTTLYTDNTGGSGYWYKFTYYNSASATETAIADSIAVRGGSAGYYTSIYAIRQQAGFLANYYVSDVDIATYRTRAQSVIDSSISNRYTVPLTTPVSGNVENITAMLAAGYLLQTEYGASAQGTSKDGQAKVDEAVKMITDLQTGSSEILDSTGASLMQTIISGWPDDSTAGLSEFDDTGTRVAGGDSITGISHKF